MIELAQEQLIPIRDVPRHVPARPNGKKVHISACYRWVSRGVKGVRLDAIRIGGTTYTSLEALQRFADQLSTPLTPGTADAKPPLAREKQIDRVARALEELLKPSRGQVDAGPASVRKSVERESAQGELS